MFARAMSFAGRSAPEANNQDAAAKPVTGGLRRAFGRDITNSTASLPTDSKNPMKTVMPPAPIVQTARVDDATNVAPMNETDFQDRPYMDRPSDDIDARDEDNPLLCTAYVNQMYDNFSVMERDIALNPNYMAKQSFINEKMRAILCDWLVSKIILYDNSYKIHIQNMYQSSILLYTLLTFLSLSLILILIYLFMLCFNRLKFTLNLRWYQKHYILLLIC